MAPEFLSEIGVWTELWEKQWREGNEQGRGQVSLGTETHSLKQLLHILEPVFEALYVSVV